MNPICRTDLKNFALRALGSPALQINVTEDQIQDRIDDALERYWEFHHEGSYRAFILHTLAQAELDQGYIDLPEWVYTVLGAVQPGYAYNSLNLQYQSYMQSFGTQFIVMSSNSVSNYYVNMQYWDLINDTFVKGLHVDFNQRHGRLYLHTATEIYQDTDPLMLEVYAHTLPNDHIEVWKDRWLRDYTTALIKKQWGQNMLKYDGFTLPGGLTLNGREIYQDAITDLERLNEQLFNEEQLPIDFMVG